MSKEDGFRLAAWRMGCRRACIKACRLRKFCTSPGMKADGGSETGGEEWTTAHQARTVESISWDVCEWRRSNGSLRLGRDSVMTWVRAHQAWSYGNSHVGNVHKAAKRGGGSWYSETVTRNSDIDLVAQPISTKALVFCPVWTVALAAFFWLTQETIFQNSVKGTNQMVIVLFKATLFTCSPRS